MKLMIACCLAALLSGAVGPTHARAAGSGPQATVTQLAANPEVANASRSPEKKAEKKPKPRKTKKAARSSGAASGAK